jgi:hypothetical protein
MIPVDPSDERDAPMGGTFVRPGAVAWGRDGASGRCVSSEVIEQVLTTVAKDPERVSELLDELSRARLWLPLPVQRPVVKDAAVVLPTVEYLGSEFVPAFTSARRLTRWMSPESASAGLIPAQYTPGNEDGMPPHVVVAAADLARLLPGGVGIAVNPGAEVSVPVYAEGVAHLAAAHLMSGDVPIRLSHPPAEPKALLAHVRDGLCGLDAVRHASRAWLTVPGQGEGLVISVTLDDPASSVAHDAVVTVIERAAATVPDFAGFPIDVTFPGESEADQIDEWVAANASPFYVRQLPPRSRALRLPRHPPCSPGALRAPRAAAQPRPDRFPTCPEISGHHLACGAPRRLSGSLGVSARRLDSHTSCSPPTSTRAGVLARERVHRAQAVQRPRPPVTGRGRCQNGNRVPIALT